MNTTKAIAHAERIVKQRIEATALYDVMQDEEVAELSAAEQQH